MQFKRVLRNVDIFGQSIQLNFNGEDQYQTALGGLFSLGIIFIITLFFQQNIMDFLNRSEINVNFQTHFDADPDEIVLNEDNYMFALAIDQPDFNINPFFNITLKQRHYSRLENGTLLKFDTYIDLVPCTLDRFQNIFENQGNFSNQFTQLSLNEWLCPQLNYSIHLKGGYTSDTFSFVKITVTECLNNSQSVWKPQCSSVEARNQFLASERSFRLRMYMTNTILNPLQPRNITQVFLDDSLFFSFLPTTGTETDVYFQKYNIITNKNIFPYLEDDLYEEFNLMQQGDFRVNSAQTNDQSFSALYLRRSPYTYEVKRDFQDLADLLSYLGGFANIMVLIFGCIVTFYNKSLCNKIVILVMIQLANQVYDFPLSSGDNETLKRREIKKSIARAKSKTQIIQKPNTQEQDKIIEQLGITDRKGYLTQQIQKILNRSKPILFSCRYILYSILCERFFYDRNSILLQKAINNIKKDLDLCVIVDKVKEINLLKELLLTEDQLILFDFAPKEVINLQDEHQSFKRSLARTANVSMSNSGMSQDPDKVGNQTLKGYHKLFQAYDRVHQKQQENDKINEKLIEKLGQEIRDIFEVSQFVEQRELLNDDFQCDSVHSDPPCITSMDPFRAKETIKLNY